MPTQLLLQHALAGGPADGFARHRWRMSRPAIVVSILAHLAVLVAASQFYERGSAPNAITFEWLTVPEAPSEAVVQPPPEVAEPPAAVVAPAPPPRAATARSVSPAVVVLPPPEAPADVLPAPPVGPSRFDLDAERRAAAAAIVEQHARGGTMRAPSIDDAPPPPAKPGPKKPSIFEPQRHSGGGLLSPSKARTVVGQRLSLWCNKVSGGGFGFFGVPVCASQRIEPPSGILADSIPEYMKLKPECEETQPLAATLGETSPYPTMKCRLVPKDPDE
jgi:hypothetical protein